MSHNIFSSIEFAIRQIAKRNMAAHEYEDFVANIRRTKLMRTGDRHLTLHDHMLEEANAIANWATGYSFQDLEDRIEEKKQQAIHNIKHAFGWR